VRVQLPPRSGTFLALRKTNIFFSIDFLSAEMIFCKKIYFIFLLSMGKDFLSYVLLFVAARVAYTYISDYLDSTMQDNFTTPTVVELNKKADEIGLPDEEFKIGVQDIQE